MMSAGNRHPTHTMRKPFVTPIAASHFVYPSGHPEGPGAGNVFVYLVQDHSGNYLVDTGIGTSHPWIDEHYRPTEFDLFAELRKHRVEPGDISAVICSHLHFDHCGNNRLFPGVPIYVQRAELRAAREESYTVPEWVDFSGCVYRELDAGAALSPTVEILSTPGHTPGHQSVLLRGEAGPEIIVAQAAYTAAEFDSFGAPDEAGIREDPWSKTEYVKSLRLLHALRPQRAYFSHDATVWQPTSGGAARSSRASQSRPAAAHKSRAPGPSSAR
jgi:N-acyl homoserine lactone hydrolase